MPKPISFSSKVFEVTELDRKYIEKDGKITGVALLRINQGKKNVSYITVFEETRTPRRERKIKKRINKKLDRKIKKVLKDTNYLSSYELNNLDESELSPEQRTVYQKMKDFGLTSFDRDKITWPTSKILSDLEGDTNLRRWKLHKTYALMRKDYEKHKYGGVYQFIGKLNNFFSHGSFKTSAEIIEDYIHYKEEKMYQCKKEILETLEPVFDLDEEIVVYPDFEMFEIYDENEKELLIDYVKESLPNNITLQLDKEDSIHLSDIPIIKEDADEITEKYITLVDTCKKTFPNFEREDFYLDPNISGTDELLSQPILKMVCSNLKKEGINTSFLRGEYVVDPKRLIRFLDDRQFSELNSAELSLVEKIFPDEKQIEAIAEEIAFESYSTLSEHIVIHFPDLEFSQKKKEDILLAIENQKYRKGTRFYLFKPDDIEDMDVLDIEVKVDRLSAEFSVSII